MDNRAWSSIKHNYEYDSQKPREKKMTVGPGLAWAPAAVEAPPSFLLRIHEIIDAMMMVRWRCFLGESPLLVFLVLFYIIALDSVQGNPRIEEFRRSSRFKKLVYDGTYSLYNLFYVVWMISLFYTVHIVAAFVGLFGRIITLYVFPRLYSRDKPIRAGSSIMSSIIIIF